jgi:hypothetical protein
MENGGEAPHLIPNRKTVSVLSYSNESLQLWYSSDASKLFFIGPHCLNIGGTEARCGLIEDRNYDFPLNSLGGSMPPVVQACYKPGAVVEFEVRTTVESYCSLYNSL